jgi:hypothetical protein
VALIRAHAFEGVGDVVRSAAEFRRVLDDVPDNPDAQAGLARVEADLRAP